MPDLTLKALDGRQQKLADNASRAFERGNLEYALTACAEVLAAVPGCLPVRRLQRAAMKQKFTRSGGWMSKALTGITALPFSLGGANKPPAELLRQADKILAKDPYSITGLQLLASAAQAHDWPETVAFAYEAIREIEPNNRDNLLALGEAWLAAHNPDAALCVADEILAFNPVDGEAQTLMRKASIARTTEQGRWEVEGNFRDKLRDESLPMPLEKTDQSSGSEPDGRAPPVAASAPADPVADARQQVERYPGDADARFRLAELLFTAKEIESAIAQYQQVQKSPKHRSRALLGLARCFRVRRLHDLAVAQLVTAKSELGGLDDLKKEIVYELGLSYEQSQQPELAIAQFKEIYAEDIGFRDVAAKINAHYSVS